MALIVPNATATGASKKFININQAEPDSIDLESLGNTANYIRSGGAVTVAATNSVTAASGVAVIGGVPYAFSASTFTETLPISANRFDLVVARLTGSSVSIAVITGTEDATNPTLPRSQSTIASGDSTADTYNPATDALIAAIYLAPGTNLDTSANYRNVVDKRVLNPSPVTYTSASAPVHSTKDVIGDTVVYNSKTYIKTAASTWAQLASTTDADAARIPIGGIFAFAGTYNTAASPNPAYFLECNGQGFPIPASPSDPYYNLYQAIGTSFGAVSGNFLLPNLTGDTGVVGASSAEMAATKVASSSNTNALTDVNQLPAHNHGNITMNFGSPAVTGTYSDHEHSTINANTGFVRRLNDYTGAFTIPTAAQVVGLGGGGMSVDFITFSSGAQSGGTSSSRSISGTANVGSQTVAVPSQGSSATFSILSKSLRVRWFIRYA